MKTMAVMAAVAALSIVGAAQAVPEPVTYGGNEAGTICADQPYLMDATCYEGADSTEWFGWDGAAYKRPCKTVTVWRYLNSWLFGTRLFTYSQSTAWCWNGTKILSVQRDRWASITASGSAAQIDFLGHVGNSCNNETCSGKAGGWSAYIATQGKFQQCLAKVALCFTALPRLQQTIYANGRDTFRTSGT